MIKATIIMPQPERIGPLLTDSLWQIKETFGQFLTGLPDSSLKMFSSENNQDVVNSILY